MIAVIWNEDCRSSSIYRDILSGIESAAARKHCEVGVFADAGSYLSLSGEAEPVIVVGYETSSLYPTLMSLTRSRRRVILAGLDGERFDAPVSSITPSRRQATAQLIEYLRQCGRGRIAMVGCGAESVNDRMRVDVLRSSFYGCDGELTRKSVFFFHESVRESFDAFYEHYREFDAVICPNDYTALCFLRYCQDREVKVPDQLYLASFSNRAVGRYCVPGITTMSIDFHQVGSYAVLAWEFLQEHEHECAQMRLVVPSRLIVRGSTALERHSVSEAALLMREDRLRGEPFYTDPMISGVMRIENCLCSCDEQDMSIVHYLLDGISYDSICEALYFSRSALNYRLKKIYAAAGTSGRRDFETLFGKYYTADNSLYLQISDQKRADDGKAL